MLVRPKLRVLYISLICRSPMRSVLLWPSLYRWGNWALERLLLSQSRMANKWESGSSDSKPVLNRDMFAGGSKQNWCGRGGQRSRMSARVKVTQAIKEGLCRGEMGEGAGTWDRGLNAKALDGEYVESPLPPATNVGRELPLYYRGRGRPCSRRGKDPSIQVLMTPYPHPQDMQQDDSFMDLLTLGKFIHLSWSQPPPPLCEHHHCCCTSWDLPK